MEFIEPWTAIAESIGSTFVNELQQELPAESMLYGCQVKAIAQRIDCDDVLFSLDGSSQLAVVHLTWSGKSEQHPWPSTELFTDEYEFQLKRMLPDAEAYN
ncbi:hypothetical protein Q5H93_18710 [Hymenobacter sp. ASUV-10]|uniref:Uncharacterized protein n=1 Tax=Hymenobacter aranciens TaxID=3063996 RepID=A0ABT9BET9_9BACT|nr:hypothetical protein [Hymenobacter sp. ASUV-10]MDO7876784.1 hypothetical protein [Hymenobacter sp. ASUV-10]